jgi:hypothetical protein
MRLDTGLFRVVMALVLTSFLVGCYNRIPLPKDERLPVQDKTVVVRAGLVKYYLQNVTIADDAVRGWLLDSKSVKSKKAQELRIFVEKGFFKPEDLNREISIPFDAIEKVEVYEVSLGKTVFATAAITFGVIIGLLAAIVLSSSCPFIYAFDGETYEFSGEIYPAAPFPPLERDDYLELPALRPAEGEYRIKMANEAPQILYTNLAELVVIDHPPGTEVLMDNKGVPHTPVDVRPPTSAVTLAGEDVRSEIVAGDDSALTGPVIDRVTPDKDGVVMTFDRPPGASTAELIFQGKNTLWLDYTSGEFYELFGDFYGEWYEEQKSAPAEELWQWAVDQGIAVAVYLEKGGEWQFVDVFEIAGPLTSKRVVMPLDLSGIANDEVKVKIEFCALFWEIDCVGVDFSPDLPIEVNRVSAVSAINQNGLDVAELLSNDDGLYYIMPDNGDYATLTFPAPETTEGLTRTVFLHGKGHYEALRNPRGEPDHKLLYSFRKPGRFIEFSRGLFVDAARRWADPGSE